MSKKCDLWKIPKDELQERLNRCHNMCEAMEEFGYKRNGGGMKTVLKKIISEYGLDVSHFNPNKDKKAYVKYNLEEILVKDSHYTNINRLKKRIVRAGLLPYKCAICGNEGEWNGKPLSLQLDHRDGDNRNHSIQNLRFLCPNCHSQTDNFAGKNARYGSRQISSSLHDDK